MGDVVQDFGARLLDLADDAERAAAAHNSELKLHEQLKDLALVARSHAVRLIGELPPPSKAEEPLETPQAEPMATPVAAAIEESPAPPPDAYPPPTAQFDPTAILEALADLNDRVAALEALAAAPQTMADLPGWVRDTLANHHERITDLENRAAFPTVTPAAEYIPDAPLVVDRTSWATVDQARADLRALIRREWNMRVASRQKLLDTIIALTDARRVRTPEDEAAILQHQQQADELARADAVLETKLEEIAASDDLEYLRNYDEKAGWP